MKNLVSKVRCAIDTYNMIDENDNLAVCVSGGKDSIFMLYALNQIKKYYPKTFQLKALIIDPRFNPSIDQYSEIINFCNKEKIEYTIEEYPIFDVVFNVRKEKNPCSLCSKLRRGILDNCALKLNCNKIALGHHFDDLIETFFLNLFNNGKIDCFKPVTFLSRKKLYAIRPLILCKENEIENFVKSKNLPIIKSSCPADKKTQRQKVKEFIKNLENDYPDLKKKIFTALKKYNPNVW